MSTYIRPTTLVMALALSSAAWADNGNVVFSNKTPSTMKVQFSSASCVINPGKGTVEVGSGLSYSYPVQTDDSCSEATIDWNIYQVVPSTNNTFTSTATYTRVRASAGNWDATMSVSKGDNWPVPNPVVFNVHMPAQSSTRAAVVVVPTAAVVEVIDYGRDFMHFGK